MRIQCLLHMVDSLCFLMADKTENLVIVPNEMEQSQCKKAVSNLPADKSTRDLMIEKLRASGYMAKEPVTTSLPTSSGYNAGCGAWPLFQCSSPSLHRSCHFGDQRQLSLWLPRHERFPSVVPHVCRASLVPQVHRVR